MHVASSFTFSKKDRIGVTNTSRSLINSCYQFITKLLLLPTTKSTMSENSGVQPLGNAHEYDDNLADSMSDEDPIGASEGDGTLHQADEAKTNKTIPGDVTDSPEISRSTHVYYYRQYTYTHALPKQTIARQ